MTRFYKHHIYTLASILIILLLGWLSKFYSGAGPQWINNHAGDVLYEIFWCLFAIFIYFKEYKFKKDSFMGF